MKENKVLQALEALAGNDRHKGVAPIVELRLIQAFRIRRPKRVFTAWATVFSIAAAAALVTVVSVQHRPRHIPDHMVHAVSAASAHEAASTTTQAATIETPKVAVRPNMPKRSPKSTPVEEPATREVFTDFFPLMDPAPPFDRGEILRVQLPATAMRAVGLPVGDDHLADQIQADVLVGEEGLPRAIRFVKFEMK